MPVIDAPVRGGDRGHDDGRDRLASSNGRLRPLDQLHQIEEMHPQHGLCRVGDLDEVDAVPVAGLDDVVPAVSGEEGHGPTVSSSSCVERVSTSS